MSSSILRISRSRVPGPVLLTTVELDRRSGVLSDPVYGLVELVDHVNAWVFEDGTVLAAVLRRSAVVEDRVLAVRAVTPAAQASLTATWWTRAIAGKVRERGGRLRTGRPHRPARGGLAAGTADTGAGPRRVPRRLSTRPTTVPALPSLGARPSYDLALLSEGPLA